MRGTEIVTHALWTDKTVSGYGHGSDGRGGGWPGLRQVVHIRTTREPLREGLPTSTEDHYYLTSLSPDKACGKPEALLNLARGHWGIENSLHHVKDRSMGEDADRTHRGATLLARLRSLAVGALARFPGASVPQKHIWLSANPFQALKTLRWKRWPKIRN